MISPEILVVEDNAAHAELIGRAFEPEEGFHLRHARCLEAARSAIEENHPELVITDLLLPDGRGTDLLPGGEAADFPVVIMSGHGDEHIAVEVMKAGAVDYVVKSSEMIAELPRIAATTIREWRHIVERRRAERALHASERRYRTLFDNNPSMFFTVSRDGILISVNRFAAEQLGYEVSELVGRKLADLHLASDQREVLAFLEQCFDSPAIVQRWQTSQRHKDGSQIWLNVTARAIEGADTDTMALIVCEDVTEARRLSKRLAYHASHDPLTGLANRRRFESCLNRALHEAREKQTEHVLCFMDLDQFKVINDTCGHGAGDELLRQVSALLTSKLRCNDILARLGGDEFGVVLSGCSVEDGLRVAGSLQGAVQGFRFVWDDKSFAVGVSIGLVTITADSRDVSSLLTAADSACYVAKDMGRNRIHLYYENDRQLAKRHGEMQWVTRINRALEEERFLLYCQPIMQLSGASVGLAHFELLLRMQGEGEEEVLPGAFLGAAERYGLVRRIDRWVVEKALDALAQQRSSLDRLGFCSINLSGRSVGDRELIELIVERLASSGVPPEKICFEITETVAIANLTRATDFIRQLRALGCRFALDDFGSGLSSFGYLRNLPVDFIKIDGMFVRDILQDPMDLVMIKSIHDLGRVMGKKTIAEFVENEEILAKLTELGIDFAQGFHVGPPQPLDSAFSELASQPPPEDQPARPSDKAGAASGKSSARVLASKTSARRYRILQVDDDPVIIAMIKAGLQLADFEVWSAASGEEAIAMIKEKGCPHLALVDLFMPGMSGLELCRTLKRAVDLPIIMLTSMDDNKTEADAIQEVAEDFIRKPLDLGVLVARIHRVLGRIGCFDYTLGPRIRVDDRLEVEPGNQQVLIDGQAIELTPIENKLLYILMQSGGAIVTTEALLHRVWPDPSVGEPVLRTHIARLRRKIEAAPHRPRYVLTRRGRGYCFGQQT
ncbi:MAG: EAL domain-containing protein [Acidobacteriota bacterium]